MINYIEVEHPNEGFDVIISFDENNKVIDCRDILTKEDIEMTREEKKMFQGLVDKHFG